MPSEMTKWELEQKCKELEKYNGYTNYETWAVASWIDNDENLQNETYERAKHLASVAHRDENVKNKIWTKCETVKFRLADELKERFEDDNPLADKADLFSDLIGSALSNVDWHDVAEQYLPETLACRKLRK